MISMTDIHWIAGILEGEGSFVATPTSERISLSMTDADVVIRAAVIMGCDRVISFQETAHTPRKRKFIIYIYNRQAIAWCFTLYSLMGERRRIQIRKLIENWKHANRVQALKPRGGWSKHVWWHRLPEPLPLFSQG
jgi:hypothetical protein